VSPLDSVLFPLLTRLRSESILLRYIPALTLPQLLPPGKSFTGKAMADAVKLSRNTTLARTSPMSTFLAAKGSTAWETSVKSRLETPSDEVPLGWRILEKDHKKDEKAEEKVKKPAGLLAGLWGRRASNAPSNPLVPQQSTPSPNAPAPEIEHPVPTQNQHSSTDGAKIPSGTAPTSQAHPKPFHERTSSQVREVPHLLPFSPPSADLLAQDDDTHTPPSGSAVSRFLHRFSRPRASSSSPRNSLALSSDDLEFLSDVRSKSNDPSQTIDGLIAGLKSETEGTENSTLYGKLPPPLPPPPKVSSSSPHGATPPPRGNMLNRDTLVPPDDPLADLVSDLQSPTEKPSIMISAMTPLTPGPTTAIDLDSPQSMSPHSVLSPSHPLPLDRIRPPPSVSAFPLLSSQPGPAFSSPSDSQPQFPLASASTTQSFGISQDDDDFSDFRSSPADPPLLPLNASLLSSSQGKVPLSQHSHRQSSSPFDDLVHLMSSPTTGPPNTVEEPDPTPLFSFASPALPTAPSPPKPQVSAHGHRASLDRPDTAPTTPTHSRSNSQLPTSPPKATPTSPKQKMITQGHQRTQSLLDLAAARRGRWPAPPSPLPEPLSPPPPPTEKGQGGGVMNVDYFGATTPTDESTNLPPAPPGKSSLMPSLSNATALQVDPSASTRGSSPAPSVFGAFAQPQPRSGSPAITLSAPPAGQSMRRVALSPPPRSTAIMNNSPSRPPSSSPTPVPLLPPPSGYRLAAPAKPSPAPAAPLSPESTPLAFLMDNNEGTNVGLPAAKATPPPPVKGAGGLSAQDLSFFEGL